MESADFWKISLGIAVVILLFVIFMTLREITNFVYFAKNSVVSFKNKLLPRKKPADSST